MVVGTVENAGYLYRKDPPPELVDVTVVRAMSGMPVGPAGGVPTLGPAVAAGVGASVETIVGSRLTMRYGISALTVDGGSMALDIGSPRALRFEPATRPPQ
jgi:hypothetical protein